MIRRIVTLFFCCLFICVASCGCLRKERESIISFSAFREAMEEYDAEEYSSYPGIEEQLDNPRAMLAGMYAPLDAPALCSDAQLEVKFVQRIEGDEGAYVEMEGHLLQFDSEDSAVDFYDEYCDEFDVDLIDDLRYAFSIDASERRAAECIAVYCEYDHVLIMTGREFKDNGLVSCYEDLCSLLDIPAPDLSVIDCNAPIPSEERVPLLCEDMDAEEIDASEFDFNWVLDEPGCYFVQTDDLVSIAGVLEGERLAMYDNVIHTDIFFSIDSVPEDLQASRFVVMRVQFDSPEHAREFYEDMMDDVAGRQAVDIEMIDSGEADGINYTKYKMTDPYMSASYNLYYEGDAAYVLSFLNMDEKVAADTIQHVCDVMSLP